MQNESPESSSPGVQPGDNTKLFGERQRLPDDALKSWDPDKSDLLASFGIKSSLSAPGEAIAASAPLSSEGAQDLIGEAGYHLVKRIGVGGFGEVWEAVQKHLGRRVAVKLMRRDLSREGSSCDERLRLVEADLSQEALAAAALDHPNIVPLYDLFTDTRGLPAIVMKLAAGRQWSEIIKQDFPVMPTVEFLAKHLPILENVCQAVAFAHAHGILHRDLKPAQVMVGEFGETLLMDWGLAVLWNPDPLEDSGNLRASALLPLASAVETPAGTMAFMAPEQARPAPGGIGTWTDIYLLGGILHQLLTGFPPHTGNTISEMYNHVISGAKIEVAWGVPGREIPARLAQLCERALSPDRAERPESARAFLEVVHDCLTGSSRREEARAACKRVETTLADAGDNLEALAECARLLDRARELWPECPPARNLAPELDRRRIEAALAGGDAQLAGILVADMPPGPAKDALEGRVFRAFARRARKASMRRVAEIVGMCVIVALAAGSVWHYFHSHHGHSVPAAPAATQPASTHSSQPQ